MSFWTDLKNRAASLNAGLQTSVAKFKNAEFANASMAMCAMVAAADGSVAGAEKARIATLIMNNETLKVFPAAELKQKFDFYCDKLTADFEFGRIEALQAVGKLRAKPDQARAVILIGIVIGGADGNFDTDEKNVVRAACNAVGIPASEFDL
jgi:tellurite resistance protein TerB